MRSEHIKWIKRAAAGVVLAVCLLLAWLGLLDRLLNGILDVFTGAATGFVLVVGRLVEFINRLAELVASWF